MFEFTFQFGRFFAYQRYNFCSIRCTYLSSIYVYKNLCCTDKYFEKPSVPRSPSTMNDRPNIVCFYLFVLFCFDGVVDVLTTYEET